MLVLYNTVEEPSCIFHPWPLCYDILHLPTTKKPATVLNSSVLKKKEKKREDGRDATMSKNRIYFTLRLTPNLYIDPTPSRNIYGVRYHPVRFH